MKGRDYVFKGMISDLSPCRKTQWHLPLLADGTGVVRSEISTSLLAVAGTPIEAWYLTRALQYIHIG